MAGLVEVALVFPQAMVPLVAKKTMVASQTRINSVRIGLIMSILFANSPVFEGLRAGLVATGRYHRTHDEYSLFRIIWRKSSHAETKTKSPN